MKPRSELAAQMRNELFLQIEEVVLKILKDHNITDEVADLAASAVTDGIASDWAGQTLTFTKDYSWRLLQRDLDVYSRYNGRNHLELARELGVGTKAIYTLIKRVRKILQQNKQDDLFSEKR